MTSDIRPDTFLVDLMDRRGIARSVRAAESNPVLHSGVDIFVSVWQLIQAEKRSSTSRGNSIVKKGLDSTYNLIQSSVTSENAEMRWEQWLEKRDGLLADTEKERIAARANRGSKKVNTEVRLQEQWHIEDVARFEAAFGVEDAVLLANLLDVKTWYAWPKPRKEVILYYLDPEYNKPRQNNISLGAKRAADCSGDDLEERVKRQTRPETEPSIERQFTSIAEHEPTPSGTDLSHPVLRPVWTGSGEPFLPIYEGQFSIVGSADRWIQYRWSAVSAIDETSLKDLAPAGHR